MSQAFGRWLRFKLVEACLVFGRRERAAGLLQALVRQDAGHRRAWATLGFLHSTAGRHDAAVEAFERALALQGDDPDVLFNLGYTLQKAGRHAEAIERFEGAIGLNAFLDRAWYGAGLSLLHLRRLEEAVAHLREAARLQPMNPYAGYQLGAALFRLGRSDEVRAEYERVKGFDPKISEQMRRDFGLS